MALPEFFDDANCRGASHIFFPSRGGQSHRMVVKAKEICAGCTVREPCLEWAMQSRSTIEVGVFGGTTGTERRAINTRDGFHGPIEFTAGYWLGELDANVMMGRRAREEADRQAS